MTVAATVRALIRASAAERWAPLPTGLGDEYSWATSGYWVSSAGRVLAVLPRAPRGRRLVVKALRVERRPRRRPHTRTNLHAVGGGDRTVRVHRLVAAAWLPRLVGGVLVRHLNGDGTDNRVRNLLRGTWSDNLSDQYRHGRAPQNQYTCPTAGTPF